MTEADDDILRFSISGETSRNKLLELQTALGAVGVAAEVSAELRVSPSIVVELAHSFRSPAVPAITRDSVALFLESEGMEPAAAQREGDAIEHSMRMHVIHGHNDPLVWLPIRRRDDPICECPLRLARVIRRSSASLDIAGIDPTSFLEFTALADEDIKRTLSSSYGYVRVGPKRLKVIRKMQERLASDLGEDLANTA